MATLNDIASLVNGTVIGDGDIAIKGMMSPASAKEGDITFAFDKQGFDLAAKSDASCVLSTVEVPDYPKTVLRVEDMKLAMTVLYNAMLEMRAPGTGCIHRTAAIDETAVIGKGVDIGPNAVIGEDVEICDNSSVGANCVIEKGVKIGSRTHIYPNVTVYADTVIGDDVIIHSGAVLGADGFGYIPKDGKIYKVPQLGRAIIEDSVEIGANTCIDRGTFTDTVIGKGTKLDNLIQIAHNVKIGKNNLIAAQCGIAGSSTTGENVMMGGKAGIVDHATVGNNVKIGAKTGVTSSVGDGRVVFGYPYREAPEARKLHGLLTILLKSERKLRKFLRTLSD